MRIYLGYFTYNKYFDLSFELYDEISNNYFSAKELKILNEIYDGNQSEQNIHLRKIVDTIFSKTIFNNREDDGTDIMITGQSNHISLDDAIQEFKQEAIEAIKNRRVLPVLELEDASGNIYTKNSKDILFTEYMNYGVTKDFDALHTLLLSKIQGTLDPNDTKALSERLDIVLKFAYPTNSKINATNIQYALDGTIDIQQMTSLKLKQIMDSIPVARFNIVAVRDKDGNITSKSLEFDKYLGGLRTVTNAWEVLRGTITRAVSSGDFMYSGDIATDIENLATYIIRPLAESKARVGSDDYGNSLAFQLMSVYDMLYDSPYSIFNKYQNTDNINEINALEDFWHTFMSHMQSTSQNKPAFVSLTKGINPKNLTEEGAFTSYMLSKVRRKVLDTDSQYKSWIEKEYGSPLSNPSFRFINDVQANSVVLRVHGKNFATLKYLKNDVMIELNKTDGKIDFKLIDNMRQLMSSYGVTMSNEMIRVLLENPEFYYESISETVRKSADIRNFLNYFAIGSFMSMNIGAKLQYAKAQIMAIDNKKSTTVDNETNYNYASEIISYFDRMVSNIYGSPDKTAEQITKDIAKVRQDVDALFKQAVKRDLLTNEQVNDIKALWSPIEDLAPYYGTILRKFRGFAFIKSDIEIRDVMADERDAALDQIKEQDKSYTPNPLQFDFALKGLHGIVSNYTTTGKTERIGNKTKQIYREATNADKVYLRYFNAPSAERQRQMQKLDSLLHEMHRQGRFPSMIFNPAVAGQGIKINDIIDISEMRNGSFKTAEIVPTDTLMTMLIAAADGTKNGSYRYIDSPRGDSGKVVAIEASSMLGTISPNQKFTSLDMDKKPSVATIEAIDNIKNIMRTYHMKHLQSATDFINVMNSIVPMLSGKEAIDVKILVDEMNMIIQKHKEPLVGKILGLDHTYDIPNYNFWKIYQNSAKVLNILNESGQVENVYNVLRNLGLVDGIDIVEGKDGKALGGRALHMNIKTKNADLKYDILDRTYNALRIYRSGELETQSEGIRTAEEEAQIRESAYSSIEVNPKTNREAWEWISRLFYSDLAAMQNKIKSLSSQADFNMPDYVRDILTINYNENKEFIPFFEQKTIESNPEYAINWGMLNYFMMNHIVGKSVSHMINGHDINYKDAADLTNRSKINYTNGKVATPSNKGMGQKFQAIILRDSVMKQAIEKYNMVTNQSLTVEEIIEATDGTTIDTAIGRHFYNKSMGGNMNAYTGKVKKTVYSFNDMLTDEYTMIKHAQDIIDPESVRKNNHQVFLEYIALATLDEQIANEFLDEMYTVFNNEEVTNIGYVFQEAIDKAIQAIQAKRETGELDINNMVLFFTHPSAVKKGAMYVNDASIIDNNEVDMAEEMSAQQFRTVSLNTEGLREVFDSNSQIENSRESVLATQAFAAVQSILPSDSATEADRLLAENMYNNLSNLGMKSNGDVKNDKVREKIMNEAIELMVTGQLQTKREGQTLRLSQMMINNRNIMHLPNITQLLVQTLNKMVNNETSKIRYKGSSYVQVSDATYRLYDATITYPDGTVMTQAVTDEGRRKLNRQSKTGLLTVEYSAPRKMKPMDHKEGKISRAEAIMGTTTQKMFGITGEHSIVDVIHILVDDKVININAIDEKGMYNGKQIFDSEGNLANAEGVILNKDTNKKFKNHLNTINQFKQSLNILMFRKPTSLLTSGGMYQVVEFEHTGNRVITSAKKNAWDDSDYDIDKLFSYEYEHENTESARLINSYYNMIENAFTKLATDGNIRAGISTEGVNEVAGEMKPSEKGTPNTMWSNYDTNNRAYVGAKSISRWANTLVTANTIGRIAKMKLEDRRLIFNDNYKGRFGEAYDILNRMFNNPKEYEFYVSVAVMLQAAVDNTKEAKLGRLGVSQYATNEIVAMLYDGKSLSEIKDFMMNPVVAKVYSNIENAESLSGNMNILTPFMLLATDRLNETAKQSYEYTMPEGFQEMIEETKADVSVNMADLTDEQVADLMSNRDRAQINLDDSPMAIANKKAAGYRDLTSKYWQQRNKLAQKINDIRLDPKGLDEDILSLKSEMTELDEKHAREVGILNTYIKYQLQKYSVVGEVVRRMTFFMDIKDGVASKPHQFDNSISNIEREYGMPIEQIDFSPKGLKPITHDTGSLKRIMNYEFEHNDYYKKLDTDMQRAYEGLFGAVSSMVKLGNMIYLMPHMRLYATQHKFVNQLREQFTMFNPLLQQNLNKALHASYRGNNGNPTSYYARQNALTGVMLSVAFDRMIENRRVFGEKEQYGKAITLETYDINEIMTVNEFNKAYESIDISDAKQGRQRFIKRLPTYMVNMGGLMDLYYNARMNNQNTSHYENIFRDVYLIDSTEIERMFVGMERAKGNHFMNFIEQVGSEHQSLMVIKNSKQLLENPHAYQEVRMMFENLPNRVQELFGVYEVILNQFETRSASLHDIISEKMYETLAEYLSDHTDLNMDISYNNAFYDNTVTTDKVLSTIMVTDIDSMIPKLRDAISKYGPTEDVNGTMVKYGIVKVGSKEKINNSNVVYKKIYLSELQEQVGEDGKAIPVKFNDIGTVVFNNVLSNAIPYSNTESMVSPNRAMKNLSEKNIYEVLKGNRTLINLYSGHNFKETDISQGGTHYVYSTNAGVNVIIDSIADKHIIVKPVGQVVGLQDKVEAKNKTISYAKMEIRALSEAIQTETKRINETFEVYGIKDEQGNIIKTVYRTKDGKITAVRVSSLLGDPTIEFTDTEKDMFFSDGNLADAISKSVLKEAITRSLGRMDVITDMSIAAQKGTLAQHPLVKLALETFDNNYKLVRGEADNHAFSKYSKEEMVTLMAGYIRSIMNSNFEHLITMLKSNTETNVEVLTDVRLMRNYNGNLVMGEADILVLYHDSIRKKNRFVVIDTKTSNLSYLQDGQPEAIVKAFNQIAVYSQMMNSMYGLSESSFDKSDVKNAVWHIQKFSKFQENVNFVEEKGIKEIQNIPHNITNIRTMENYKRTIEEFKAGISEKVKAETDKNMELISKDGYAMIKIENNEATKVNCK